jgi:hypothetical protein
MPLKPYEEFAPGPLVFPIGGKSYEVPEVRWDRGLKLRDLLEDDNVTTADERNALLLGDAYEQMQADNVPAAAIARAVLTALVDFRLGREAAEQVWESGLSPEARAPQGATETASTSTDEATTTPTPGSTSGTTSPKASSKAKAKAASK